MCGEAPRPAELPGLMLLRQTWERWLVMERQPHLVDSPAFARILSWPLPEPVARLGPDAVDGSNRSGISRWTPRRTGRNSVGHRRADPRRLTPYDDGEFGQCEDRAGIRHTDLLSAAAHE